MGCVWSGIDASVLIDRWAVACCQRVMRFAGNHRVGVHPTDHAQRGVVIEGRGGGIGDRHVQAGALVIIEGRVCRMCGEGDAGDGEEGNDLVYGLTPLH